VESNDFEFYDFLYIALLEVPTDFLLSSFY